MQIRQEEPGDAAAIRQVTADAFAGLPYSDQSEPRIVDALREAGALVVSLVAVEGGDLIGHAAFSPVQVAAAQGAWFGLGPVSVAPEHQRRGVGQALIRTGLDQLKAMGAAGCVVLGDPDYYRRFGFRVNPTLTYEGQPSPYLQSLAISGAEPRGEVVYHRGFAA